MQTSEGTPPTPPSSAPQRPHHNTVQRPAPRPIPEKKEIITPKFQDVVLFDETTGEPFVFTRKEQEFFTNQGYATIPKKTPVRRRIEEIERYDGQELTKVTCRRCGKAGKVLAEVADPEQVLCDECFAIEWEAYLAAHPEYAAEYRAAEAAADAELERLKALQG